MIIVKDLNKTYRMKKGDTVHALNGISLSLPEAGMVFILGKSGSGKSTFLNIIGGLDKADSGELIVNGKSLHKFSPADYDYYRNTCVGFVFQDYNLIDELTVEQNIALALQLQKKTSATEEEVKRVLGLVDLQDFGKRHPNMLSGGQRQRIAIARALIKNPDIILADEPTGALDSETGKDILEMLKRLSEERLVLIVSHDREAAEKFGDRIIELKDGKITADRTAGEVSDRQQKADDRDDHGMIKSGLPFAYALKLGASSLTRHRIRLAFMLIISILAFTMFGAASTATLYDVRHSAADAVSGSGYTAALLSKEYWTDYTYIQFANGKSDREYESSDTGSACFGEKEIEEINKKVKADGLLFAGVFMVGDSSTADFRDNSYLDLHDKEDEIAEYYTTTIHWFSDCGETYMKNAFGEDCLLAGSYPVGADEIAISEYYYEFFREYGYYNSEISDSAIKISSPEDLIGKTLSISFKSKSFIDLELTITGVYNAGDIDERYDALKESYPNTSDDETAELKAEFDRVMENSFHTTVFVSREFYELYGNKLNKLTPVDFMYYGYAQLNLKSNGSISNNDSPVRTTVITDKSLSFIAGAKVFSFGETEYQTLSNDECLIGINSFLDRAKQLASAIKPGETSPYAETHTQFAEALERLETANPLHSYQSPSEADIEVVFNAMQKDWNEYIDRKDAAYETYDTVFLGKDNQPIKILGVVYSVNYSKVNETGFYVFTSRFIRQNATEWSVNEGSSATNYREPTDGRYSFVMSPADNSSSETYRIISLKDRDKATDVSYQWQNELYRAAEEYKETFDIYGLPFLIAGLILGGFAALLFGNFITVSISGRQKEIGILRALGARNTDVFKIYIVESSILSLICFTLAAVCSAIASKVIDVFLQTQMSGVSFSMLHFGILNALLLFGLIVVIAFISTALPVLLSSKKQPIENIRAA